MKKIMILCAFLIGFNSVIMAQGVVTVVDELQIGYSDIEDNVKPDYVKLGVEGHVYIQSGPGEREISDEFRDLFLLFVEKGVLAEDLAILSSNVWLADYVFEPEYQMRSLEEMQAYVKENKHLPNIIGQQQLDEQEYFSVNKMLMGQLQNLEELVLHTIAQEEKIKSLESQISKLESLAAQLEEKLELSKK